MKRRSFGFSLCLALLLLVLTAASVSAHARLLRSNPEDGAILKESPGAAFLWFDEPIAIAFSTVEVFDTDGKRIITSAPAGDLSDPQRLMVTLPELPDGVYRLVWKAASDTDSHPTQGSIVFGVGESAAVLPASPPAAEMLEAAPSIEIALRAVNYAAFAFLVGSLIVAGTFLRLDRFDTTDQDAVGRARLRIWKWGIAAAIVMMLAVSGLTVWQSNALGGIPFDDLLASRLGALWLAREVTLQVCFVALLAARSDHRGSRWLAWLALLVLAILQALGSHAAGVPGRPVLAVASDAAHYLAAGAWVGSMLALLVGLLPLLRSQRLELRHIALSTWRRFSVIAALSVGAIAATGLFNAGQQVASIDAAIGTAYGRVLGGKIGLFVIAGLCGLINLLLLHPHASAWIARPLGRPSTWTPIPRRRLPIVLLAEAALTVIVLAASGALAAIPPARGPEFAPPETPERPPSTLTLAANDLLITLSIRPNKPGLNLITIEAVNTRRPAPAAITAVYLNLAYRDHDLGSQTMSIEPADTRAYRLSSTALNASGAWRAQVIVQRAGLADSIADFDWRVESLAPSVPPRPVVISNAPLEPLLAALAVGLVLVTILAGAGVQYWKRMRRLLANETRTQRRISLRTRF
jgi:copper transport protein